VPRARARRAGVRFGPPGGKRLVYFVDDINMPFVDKYDTQSAIELLRQSLDYRGWFDKARARRMLKQPLSRALRLTSTYK
jgi:dynein heavy chain